MWHDSPPSILKMADWLSSLQWIVHYGLHLLFPGLIAYLFFRKNWKKAWLIMIATMLVDLDHLFSDPIFDPTRCSINHHILHTYPAMAVYALWLIFPKTRIVAVGLLFHMLTDFQDCLWSENLNLIYPPPMTTNSFLGPVELSLASKGSCK